MIKTKLNRTLFWFFVWMVSGILLCPRPGFSGDEKRSASDKKGFDSKDGLSQKDLKKSSKRRHHRKAKNVNFKTDQAPAGAQEDVTDQREVSQQADQSAHKKIK